MAKLIGSGSQGAYLKAHFQATGQTAAESGFKHVNKSWFDKCLPMSDVIQAMSRDQRKIIDRTLPVKAVKPQIVDFKDGKGPVFALNVGGDLCRPTEHACDKLAYWTNLPTAIFEKLTGPDCDERDHAQMVALVANSFRKLDPEKELFWRTWDDGTLRAVMSTKYAVINNQWFLEAVEKIVPNGVASHWRGDADTVFGNVLIPDSIRSEEDSDYGGGLSLSNCEVGQRVLAVDSWLFSVICWNGNIWDQTKGKALKRKHMGTINLPELGRALQRSINEQIPLITAGLDLFLSKREFTTKVNVKPIVAQLAREFRIAKPEATEVLIGYNTEVRQRPTVKGTLFGIIHGVTRAAQKLSNQRWVALDQIGGQLTHYSRNDWDRLTRVASELKPDQVDDSFLTSVELSA